MMMLLLFKVIWLIHRLQINTTYKLMHRKFFAYRLTRYANALPTDSCHDNLDNNTNMRSVQSAAKFANV